MSQKGQLVTEGFEDFRKGTFGNAGHNLYVSKAGVLQRIFQYDLNQNGYLDLIICASQNHCEVAPTYVYDDPFGECKLTELPTDNVRCGVLADFNGNGYDDLVLGMGGNAITPMLNSFIYFGSPEGFSEKRRQLLPVPKCTAVAAGDFNGDGKQDLAFLSFGKVRMFYQTELGFELTKHTDLEIEGRQLAAADLDGDGFAELIVRKEDGEILIFWGSKDGIDPERSTRIPIELEPVIELTEEEKALKGYAEWVPQPSELVQVIDLNNTPHVSVIRKERVHLVPVDSNRNMGEPLVFECPEASSVAIGDIKGNGQKDMVIAAKKETDEGQFSSIYWGSENGYSEDNKTLIKSLNACDVTIGDLNGDGCCEVVISNAHTEDSFTTQSFIYRGTKDGIDTEPVKLQTEDPQRVFIPKTPDDSPPKLIFANYMSRSLIGYDKNPVYFGGPDGFSPDRKQDVPAWVSTEALYCDINDDGYADLVIANCAENSVWLDPGSYVLLNGPNGLPDKPSIILPTKRGDGVCCADLNRNGYLDLIFAGFDNSDLTIFYGNADGFDTENPEIIPIEFDGKLHKEPRWIYLADLNNNGWLDLIVPVITNERSIILWGGPEGFSMERSQKLAAHRACCIRAADLTGNGYLDLLVGGHQTAEKRSKDQPSVPHESHLYIYWNGPEGLSETNRQMLHGDGINSMAIADFNNNGLLDIYIGSYHALSTRDTNSFIYWNRPGIGFRESDCKRLFTHSSSGSIAADFNENGWVDLAVANHKVWKDHDGYSEVWWNGPDGFDPKNTTRLPAPGPHGITAVEPGNIMDRGPEEYYISPPNQLPEGACVTAVSWKAEMPPKTWVKAQLRFAKTKEELETAAWQGPKGEESWFEKDQKVSKDLTTGQYVQYRLAIGATNSLRSPRITAVNINYKS